MPFMYVGQKNSSSLCFICGKPRSEHKENPNGGSPLCPQGTGLSTPQPTPTKNVGEAVYDLFYKDLESSEVFHIERQSSSASRLIGLVLVDAKERDKIGEKKYGTRLGLTDGRDDLIDPYQEALDLCVYLRKSIQISPNWLKRIAYQNALRCLLDIRQLIYERDGK